MADPFAEAAAALADSRLGTDAIYTAADGSQTACRVILSRPLEVQQGLGQAGVTLPALVATLPQAALPETPARGRVLTVDGQDYVLSAPPEADTRGANWALPLRKL